ncbi:hypothetical protein EKG37_06925 [Robertmurraya yapensis]|uniref:Uncharacterized protein n=1 Tax=Bacillus yapensis TaxID=2492960 RepID=A0A3S0K214_9BACI|nr:hypothetical protein [Bacillus yapensis]RTR33940.1 hypothetical protein EKG37_06925 [Bacillus yapensis]TKS97258.1 hypothetical protein FAR12_06925 [Bacillus yapensis]
MKVRTLYLDSIHYEEPMLAYYILHLLENKRITLDDDISKLDWEKSNHEQLAAMIKENKLGFHPIKIFSLKMDQNNFVFIFAASPEEATQFYIQTFRKLPLNCVQQLLEYELVRGNETLTFRDMKKEYVKFPAVAGCYVREY